MFLDLMGIAYNFLQFAASIARP